MSNAMVTIALLGWAPLMLVLFALIPARRAAFTAIIGGWLFLPMATMQVEWIPNLNKTGVIAYSVLLGVAVFDAGRLLKLRPRWFDLPVLVYCLSPIASSLTNGLGLYDGIVVSYGQMLDWGVPYLAGRLYAADLEGLRELAVGLVLGGLIYVPLCLYEVRMSPQLHRMVYGYHQHVFAQTIRWGGYRPVVFMQHGLGVGMWMSVATLAAFWLWFTGSVKRIAGVPLLWCLPVLLVTTILCKSVGAWGLLVVGLGTLILTTRLNTRLVLACLIALPISYIGLRGLQLWDGQELIDALTAVAGADKTSSVQFRMDNEEILVDWARRKPVFGWGGWGRNRPEGLRDHIVTDGLWVIILGQRGWVGLLALWTVLMLPAILLLRRLRPAEWKHPSTAPVALLGIITLLFVIDCLLNAMMTPPFLTAGGGLIAALSSPVRWPAWAAMARPAAPVVAQR